MSVVEVRAGTRRFLIGPRSEFPLQAVGAAGTLAVALLRRETAQLAALKAQLDPHSKLKDYAAWLESEIASGRLVAVEIIEAGPRLDAPIVPARPRAELVAGAPTGGGAPATLRSLPAFSKVTEMLLQSPQFMPEEVRKAFLAFISPEALKMLAGTLAVWGGAHFVGVGEAVDVLLLGIGYALIGWQVFDAIESLGKGVAKAIAADKPSEMEDAAREFAHGVTTLGVNAILILLTRSPKGRSLGAGEAEAVTIARWQSYIDGLALRFYGSRASLWARLGDKGEAAAAFARAEGRITLETVLKDTGFFERYAAEFGDAKNAVTAKIWQMISEKFASQLRGTVVVYTDQLKLQGGETQLSAELMTILDRPGVEGVVFKDVTNPSQSVVWKHADIVKARGSAPASGLWN